MRPRSCALYGTGVSPQGIITAYAPTLSAIAPQTKGGGAPTAEPNYRTDCPVYQLI